MMLDVFPVVMPLFDRGCYLERSLGALAQWDLPIKLYFFQDNYPPSRRHLSGVLEQVASKAKQLCCRYDLSFEFNCRDQHLGISKNIPLAISQVFDFSDYLFCIEDDVLVSSSFPEFCFRSLEKERDLIVNANRFSMHDWNSVLCSDGVVRSSCATWRSRIFHSWGWFCSKSIWMQANLRKSNNWDSLIASRLSRLPEKYVRMMHASYLHFASCNVDSWAFPFQLSLWRSGIDMLCPYINMASHIGVTGNHFFISSKSDGPYHYHYQPFYDGPITKEMLDIDNDLIASAREADEIEYCHFIEAKKALRSSFLRDMMNPHMCFSIK